MSSALASCKVFSYNPTHLNSLGMKDKEPKTTESGRNDENGQDTGEAKTVIEFIKQLGTNLEFPNGWLSWPPDTFALTSILFRRTGCYRHALSKSWDQPANWQSEVEEKAQDWLQHLSESFKEEKAPSLASPLEEFAEELKELGESVSLEALRVVGSTHLDSSELEGDFLEKVEKAEQLCALLLKLHAVSDEACCTLGLLASRGEGQALARCYANLMMTYWGSLSTLPKHVGVVLPKMRTPQSGLTLRSLSHHVTFHDSEVEVMWRSVPWMNDAENTANILAVPLPFEVAAKSFKPEDETLRPTRYFNYSPEHVSNTELDDLRELVDHIEANVGRVHIVILPEGALSNLEFERLLGIFCRDLKVENAEHPRSRGSDEEEAESGRSSRSRVPPIIISGVRNSEPPPATSSASGGANVGEAETDSGSESAQSKQPARNEVRLASYFAGRWYVLSQRKHHRWRLDGDQIRQYKLDGRLSTTRNWFEHFPIAQRRLSFFAPNAWLTLCPLICEDLAQLEPVSEIIRGIGPTLLFALLLDGPQLKERWSARYASVFADDPGTAVLTHSSLGMVRRSIRLEKMDGEDASNQQAFGLWKDRVTGWKLLEAGSARSMLKGSRSPKDYYHPAFDSEGWEGKNIDGTSEGGKDTNTVLLTIAADRIEEFTVDGRGDHMNAAEFRLEGVRYYTLKEYPREGKKTDENKEEGGDLDKDKNGNGGQTPPSQASAEGEVSSENQYWLGKAGDFRELSSALHVLDSVITLRGQHVDIIVKWLQGKADLSSGAQQSALSTRLNKAIHSPQTLGIDVDFSSQERSDGSAVSKSLEEACEAIQTCFEQVTLDEEDEDPAFYWSKLADYAISQLEKEGEKSKDKAGSTRWHQWRARKAVALGILALLHNRMDRMRRIKPRRHADGNYSDPVSSKGFQTYAGAQELLSKIEDAIANHFF